ncbi:MAG: SET domain-containing protein-lysine N-methyltransferase [Candidatus Taylorbacteria bacterium]|nr:SET domain-containing protein-lysine N-methyltransferase [Candidatus Taylorbacteria bacterium]
MSYISPKVESRHSSIEGNGLFAIETINKGDVILDFSVGKQEFIDGKEADRLYKNGFDHMFQLGDDQFIVNVKKSDSSDFGNVNHSCDPNCGFRDKFKIVAMRDVRPGEEITLDYAMMESSDYSFKCKCGSPFCRGIITGNDWMNPELQNKYTEYFQEYLQKRI